MASDYTPTNVTSGFEMEVTINTNFTEIKLAMDKLLNRELPADNALEIALDFNGNQGINLPAPTLPTEPLRLQDLVDFNNGTTGVASLYVLSGVSVGSTDLGNPPFSKIRSNATNFEAFTDIDNLTVINEDTITLASASGAVGVVGEYVQVSDELDGGLFRIVSAATGSVGGGVYFNRADSTQLERQGVRDFAKPSWLGIAPGSDASTALINFRDDARVKTIVLDADYTVSQELGVFVGKTILSEGRRKKLTCSTTITRVLILSDGAIADNIEIDGNSTRSGDALLGDGGEFLFTVTGKESGCKGCKAIGFKTVGFYSYSDDGTFGTGLLSAEDTFFENCHSEGIEITGAGAGAAIFPFLVRHRFLNDDALTSNPVDDPSIPGISYLDFDLELPFNNKGCQIVDCTAKFGTHGIGQNTAADTTFTGNQVIGSSHRGFSLQPRADGFTVTGNTVINFGATGIHMTRGSFRGTISGNSILGTPAADSVGIQAYYGVLDVSITGNIIDSRFEKTQVEAGRVPLYGIMLANNIDSVTVTGNTIVGYREGITLRTNRYPSILPNDVYYYLLGFRGIKIANNNILTAYTGVLGNYSSTYAIRIDETDTWSDKTKGSWDWSIDVTDNTLASMRFALALSEDVVNVLGTRAHLQFANVRGNTANELEGTTNFSEFPTLTNVDLLKYHSSDNSWNRMPTASATSPPSTAYGYGDQIAKNSVASTSPGTIFGWVATSAGIASLTI